MNQEAYTIRLELPAHSRFLPLLGMAVTNLIAHVGALLEPQTAEKLANELELATHELCMNIIDHAYEKGSVGSIRLTFCMQPEQKQIVVVLIDSGETFDPHLLGWPPPSSWQLDLAKSQRHYELTAVPEPSIEQERGRGLYLIKQLVDHIFYLPQSHGNQWHLTKCLG